MPEWEIQVAGRAAWTTRRRSQFGHSAEDRLGVLSGVVGALYDTVKGVRREPRRGRAGRAPRPTNDPRGPVSQAPAAPALSLGGQPGQDQGRCPLAPPPPLFYPAA